MIKVMAFTDRFIKLPIGVFDVNMKEVTGKEITQESYIMMNPMMIESYRPTYSEDDTEADFTNVIGKSGDATLVHLSISEFEALLNKHLDK